MRTSDVQWREVPSVPGYFVSRDGRVYSTRSKRELAQRVVRRYMCAAVMVGGKPTGKRVHRLVCEAFHGPPPEGKPLALHGDGNPLNNNAGNLRWGSHRENALDRTEHGRCHESRKTHCPAGHIYSTGNTSRHGGSRACKTCSRAAKLRARTRGMSEDDTRHGKPTGYFNGGCRCAPCTKAALEYNERRRTLREGEQQ